MELSKIKMLYEALSSKQEVEIAIKSVGYGYVSFDEISNEEYIKYDELFYSTNDYELTINGHIIDINDAFYCDRLGGIVHYEDTICVNIGRNEETVSREWLDDNQSEFHYYNGEYYDCDALDRHDLVILDDTGDVVHVDDAYYHEGDGWYSYPNDNDEEYVRDYHNGGYRTLMFNHKSKFKIGYEIEKEDEDVRNSIYINDFENETNDLWRKEKDGSLDSCSGFELISPTFELDIDKIFEHIESNEHLVSHINAEKSYSCGGHIHLSEDGLSGEELFDKIKGYTPLLYALYYGRVNKSYCKGKNNEDLKRDNEKYQAIKIHDNRIEFRIISAVPNVDTLKWRTKLIMMMIQNPTNDVIKAYYNVDTKFNKLLKQTYSDDKLVELKDRFIKFTKQFEDIDINKNN
jgi:hypothetical protein